MTSKQLKIQASTSRENSECRQSSRIICQEEVVVAKRFRWVLESEGKDEDQDQKWE